MLSEHPRIAVIGTSCSGKTTLARQLAETLGLEHIELDALHWGPDWSVRPDFEDRVREAADGDRWVVDGNYSRVRDIVWGRATAIAWLNYSFPLVFYRALTRTVGRLISRETLYGGNRESFRGAFLHWDGIPWWVVRTHSRRRRDYRALLGQQPQECLEVFELTSPSQVAAMLQTERLGRLPSL